MKKQPINFMQNEANQTISCYRNSNWALQVDWMPANLSTSGKLSDKSHAFPEREIYHPTLLWGQFFTGCVVIRVKQKANKSKKKHQSTKWPIIFSLFITKHRLTNWTKIFSWKHQIIWWHRNINFPTGA